MCLYNENSVQTEIVYCKIIAKRRLHIELSSRDASKSKHTTCSLNNAQVTLMSDSFNESYTHELMSSLLMSYRY